MGFATAALFLREGARVTVSGRSEGKGRNALAELSILGDAHFVRGDVAVPADASRMVEETVARFGRIDCPLQQRWGLHREVR